MARKRGASHNRPRRERPAGPTVEVRCLGPGPEHRFRSADPTRERVCEKCRRAVDHLNPSLRDGFTPGLSFDR